MSDDRGWYPEPGAGRGERGGTDRPRDERREDPYSRRAWPDPGQPDEPVPYRPDRARPAARDPYQEPPARGGRPGYDRPDPDRPARSSAPERSLDRRGDQADSRSEGYPPRGRGDVPAWTPTDEPPGRRSAGSGGRSAAWTPGGESVGGRDEPRRRSGGSAAGPEPYLGEVGPLRTRTGGGSGGRNGRRRKIIKWTAIGVSTTLVLILGVGAYVVIHLTGNIKHTALLENGVTQSPEPTDPYGRSPMNILIIGSDTRDTAADCKLGGDCGPGANADVEMVVHLSADRSNATIMSIPRDTEVTLPKCTDPTTKSSGGGYVSTINTSLQWGPACTVAAVGNLTGLTIDHFVMVDFSGVETMSDALGGVPVCVSDKMYDSYSGLRLNKGQNVVEGLSALQFVRTRHGFYDGSDLGREKAQHYFLSSMIREVRSNLNLADFTTLYKIANAATAALTVDDGLSGVTSLEGLATTLNKVPTDRITFVTMPWLLDPANANRVIVWQSQAALMFSNIKQDIAYTASAAAAATATAAASPTTAVTKSSVQVQVLNATSVSGRAGAIRSALVADGYTGAAVDGNATATATTAVYYPAGQAASAAAVAASLGLPTSVLTASTAYSMVSVVVGADWTSGTTFGGSCASAGAPAATAPADSSQLTASTVGGCVQVASGDVIK